MQPDTHQLANKIYELVCTLNNFIFCHRMRIKIIHAVWLTIGCNICFIAKGLDSSFGTNNVLVSLTFDRCNLTSFVWGCHLWKDVPVRMFVTAVFDMKCELISTAYWHDITYYVEMKNANNGDAFMVCLATRTSFSQCSWSYGYA